MFFTNTPSGMEPNIKVFFNDAGQAMAACITGLVGDLRPDDNHAIPETPYRNTATFISHRA